MHIWGFITRALLLLALLGTATVPSGMMRVQGPEGVLMVLCTPEGTKDVWLTDEGEILPLEDGEPVHDGNDAGHCVQVSVAGTEIAPSPGPLIRLPPWPMASPMIAAQRPVSQNHFHHNRSRAPPLPV
ncbi:hypothetical protein A8B83_15775 [Rhodobacteraceae bacterium EhC02]|nr:hypothetical protein A8B83_15775 [Rhodobacteraceae bacterium EhC02]